MQLHAIRAAGFSAAVDAFAQDGEQLWFISMLGSQQSVRALWARLVKGETAYLSADDLGSGTSECWLAREAWGTWRFHGARLPASASYHGMLVPDLAAYACERSDFLLLTRSEDEAAALHYRFLNRRVDLPLHPSWAEWLWDRGLASSETEALHSVGIRAYRCRPDVAKLEEDISAAVKRGRLTVPDENELAEAA
jgi:hypothetical protein